MLIWDVEVQTAGKLNENNSNFSGKLIYQHDKLEGSKFAEHK